MINTRQLIAKKIKDARLELNMTQSDLAKKVNHERSSISYIETGKTPVSADRLSDFSKALNKPIIYFLSDF